MAAGSPNAEIPAALLLRRRVEQSPTWLPVVGTSMGRTIRTNSEVLVASSAEPRFGEVWAFCSAQGTLVVHRFLRRQQGAFYFQGDAHWPDPPVSRGQLVGRVLRIRHGGRERDLGGSDRVVGGARLVVRGRARALARAVGLRRVRDLARSLLGRWRDR